MIYCCGGFREPQRVIFLFPNEKYKDRELSILVCPVCGALSAVLSQYNIKKDKIEIYRPERKNTSKFLMKMELKEKELRLSESGTKENAGYVYGLNIEGKDGRLYQYSVDFNGKKTLVKVI